MEMHSRQSLYEIHGISPERRRRRSRLTARLLIARIVSFLTGVKRAIETELTVRRAMTELAKMDDHMLRDLGIHRGKSNTGCARSEQMSERRTRRFSRIVPLTATGICRPSTLPSSCLRDGQVMKCPHGQWQVQ